MAASDSVPMELTFAIGLPLGMSVFIGLLLDARVPIGLPLRIFLSCSGVESSSGVLVDGSVLHGG